MSKSDILNELPKLRREDRQEIFDHLCAMEEKELSGLHQKWVDEALESGPARPATTEDWDGALKRGLARATKTK